MAAEGSDATPASWATEETMGAAQPRAVWSVIDNAENALRKMSEQLVGRTREVLERQCAAVLRRRYVSTSDIAFSAMAAEEREAAEVEISMEIRHSLDDMAKRLRSMLEGLSKSQAAKVRVEQVAHTLKLNSQRASAQLAVEHARKATEDAVSRALARQASELNSAVAEELRGMKEQLKASEDRVAVAEARRAAEAKAKTEAMYACAQVERDLATARADIVQIDEARMKAVEKAQAAARALQESLTENDELRAALDKQIAEVARLTEQLQKSRERESAAIQGEKRACEAKTMALLNLEECERMLDEARATAEGLRGDLRRESASVSCVTLELLAGDEAKVECVRLRAQIAKLDMKAEEYVQQIEQLKRTHSMAIRRYEIETKMLNRVIADEIRLAVKEATQKAKSASRSIQAGLEDQIDSLKKQMQNMERDAAAKLAAQETLWKKKLEDAAAAYRAIKKQLKQEIQDYKDRLAAAKNEIERLKRQHALALEALQQQLLRVQAEAEAQRNKLKAQMIKAVRAIEKQLEEALAEIELLTRKLKHDTTSSSLVHKHQQLFAAIAFRFRELENILGLRDEKICKMLATAASLSPIPPKQPSPRADDMRVSGSPANVATALRVYSQSIGLISDATDSGMPKSKSTPMLHKFLSEIEGDSPVIRRKGGEGGGGGGGGGVTLMPLRHERPRESARRAALLSLTHSTCTPALPEAAWATESKAEWRADRRSELAGAERDLMGTEREPNRASSATPLRPYCGGFNSSSSASFNGTKRSPLRGSSVRDDDFAELQRQRASIALPSVPSVALKPARAC